ncbi:MAG: sigma-70 family RNA polymerase sigma factor [Candidatus Margulisbacteria bacterium]|nr:sigma-70 family RNA polymerase sigma factor [Candidatus Margulisiibacteriota bacterium]MBU1617484.1 sigma-70 family RNA polymerase sigma factor [Candidatus Margulisiibacteriota bacterium]
MSSIEFAPLYEAHKEKVWRIASRYVFDREDREDLFQEVWLAVHKALKSFRGEAKVETWIYRVTVNTAINYAKKQALYRKGRQILAALRVVHEHPREAVDDLSVPLSKLNPRQRMVLLLADVEERPLEEIAELTGLPIGTVKSNLHRGREIVKKEVMKNG